MPGDEAEERGRKEGGGRGRGGGRRGGGGAKAGLARVARVYGHE